MRITRKSPLTRKISTLDLPIDRRSFRRWLSGEPIQYCFPDLDADQPEFILSGFMPGEFEIFCGPEPED